MFARWLSSKKHPSLPKQNIIVEPMASMPLFATIQENTDYVRQALGNSTDIVIREFTYNSITEGVAILYTDGLVDGNVINDFIMRAMMTDSLDIDPKQNPFDVLELHTLTIGKIQKVLDMKKLFHHILSGDSVILMNGYTTGLAASTKGWKDRGVTETNVETVVRGPRESFSESIRTNTASMYFHTTLRGVAHAFQLRDYKSLCIPLGLIVIVLALIVYPNGAYEQKWDNHTYIPLALLLGVVYPLSIVLISWIRGRLRTK